MCIYTLFRNGRKENPRDKTYFTNTNIGTWIKLNHRLKLISPECNEGLYMFCVVMKNVRMSARLRFEAICYWSDCLLRMHVVIAICHDCHVTMCISNSFWKYTNIQNILLLFFLILLLFCKAIIN
jgi:hypothetical protein